MASLSAGDIAERRRSSSVNPASRTYKFPDLAHDAHEILDEDYEHVSRPTTPLPPLQGLPQGLHSTERWPGHRSSAANSWSTRSSRTGGTRHGHQKSLSEAIRTVRTRKMSISENAHEIAESLKAPVSYTLVFLCGVWYSTSILTNTSSKAILTALPQPITLTVVQFLLVSSWCIFLSWIAKHNATVREKIPVLRNGIRRPNRDIIMATLPLTAFQIGGHILSSDAMARIPVSLVHTIKGLSPVMTVVAYRIFFNTKHSWPTYLSLFPLTIGVIMACSASFTANFAGLLYAFGSTILFVTQNIVSKSIFNEAAKAEADGMPIGRRKPDKLNLLCYSTMLAFLFTFPLWLWSEGLPLFSDYFENGSIGLREKPGSLDHGRLAIEFLFNGTFHFGQSLVAFVLLGMVSPVTYSVASLMKRVAVILFAIVWWGSPMTTVQGFGFALTFLGLYLYDRTSDAAKAEKRAKQKAESREHLLPLNITDAKREHVPVFAESRLSTEDFGRHSGASGYTNSGMNSVGPGRPRRNSHLTAPGNGVPISLPPGTKAEETWTQNDVMRQQSAPVR